MKQYKVNLSDKNARILERLVKSGEFKNPDEIVRKAINDYSSVLEQIRLGSLDIDLSPADNGRNRTQKDWIAYFNELNQAMISGADLYNAGNLGSDKLLESLRKDFIDSWIVSSTHNSFDGNNLSAKVTQDYGSTVRKPAEIYVAEVPVYQGESAVKVIEGKGLDYARALFNTKDKPSKILDTLSKLSQKAPEDIAFWTPSQDSRKPYPERAVRFGDLDWRFHVSGCDDFGGDSGHSRGVLIKPAQQAAKK